MIIIATAWGALMRHLFHLFLLVVSTMATELHAQPRLQIDVGQRSAQATDTGVRSDDDDDTSATAPVTGPAPRSRATAPFVQDAPIRKPTRWRISQPSKMKADIGTSTSDRAFGWSISCKNIGPGRLQIENWFVGPGSWRIATDKTGILLDRVATGWEIDGADEGVVFSDGVYNNMNALSRQAFDRVAKSERLGDRPINRIPFVVEG